MAGSLAPLHALKKVKKIDLRSTNFTSTKRDRKHWGTKLTCKAHPSD